MHCETISVFRLQPESKQRTGLTRRMKSPFFSLKPSTLKHTNVRSSATQFNGAGDLTKGTSHGLKCGPQDISE